jgi:hypothetical protein
MAKNELHVAGIPRHCHKTLPAEAVLLLICAPQTAEAYKAVFALFRWDLRPYEIDEHFRYYPSQPPLARLRDIFRLAKKAQQDRKTLETPNPELVRSRTERQWLGEL